MMREITGRWLPTWVGIGIAVVVLASVAPFVGLFAYSLILNSSLSHIVHSLHEWQTLIAGGMALEAAAIGGWFISQQISASYKQERNRLERRQIAALAAFPLLLSEINDYAQECCDVILKVHAKALAVPGGKQDAVRVPLFPPTITGQIRELIEFDSRGLAKGLGALLSEAQIQSSRLKGLVIGLEGPMTAGLSEGQVFNAIAEASKLCANANQFFNYARGIAVEPPKEKASAEEIKIQSRILCGAESDTTELQKYMAWWVEIAKRLE